jgi:hypothetical protein
VLDGRPCLCRRQVRTRKGIGADHRRGLSHFRIFRRIDHRHAGCAGLPCHRVAGRGFAVKRQAQDLAQWLIWILGGRHALSIANRQEQIPAIHPEAIKASAARTVPAFLPERRLKDLVASY